MTAPALLGGTPAFPDGLPFFRPAKPPLERVTARLAPSYERGVLTNGPLVRQFEAEAAERLGVPHVVAVAVVHGRPDARVPGAVAAPAPPR